MMRDGSLAGRRTAPCDVGSARCTHPFSTSHLPASLPLLVVRRSHRGAAKWIGATARRRMLSAGRFDLGRQSNLLKGAVPGTAALISVHIELAARLIRDAFRLVILCEPWRLGSCAANPQL